MALTLTEEIRNLLNHPWKRELLYQDRVKWSKVWASLDTFDDTQLAIEYYLNLDDFDSYSGGYLFVYGIMQALSLQQDALNNLLSALFDKTINWKEEHPKLFEIREHRHNSVGHPTKRGNNHSFHMIGRYSISKQSFELASYFPKTGDKTKFETIDIIDCIEIQNALLKEILHDTMKKLSDEFEAHRRKFEGQKIRDKIPGSYDYHVSKLFEISGNRVHFESNLNLIGQTLGDIKKEIEKRYFKIDTLTGVKLTLEILEYILKKIRGWFDEEVDVSEYELLIFVEALRKNSGDLFEMVDEVDREFNSSNEA